MPSAALVLAGLALAFALAQGSALLRGLDVSCGCYRGAPPVSTASLGLDLLLLGATLGWLARGRAPDGVAFDAGRRADPPHA